MGRRYAAIALLAVGVLAGPMVGLGARAATADTRSPSDDAPTRAVEADFLGLNGTNLTKLRAQWQQPDFATAIHGLDPGSLRIFAGATANYWAWRKGYFVPKTGDLKVPSQDTTNPLHLRQIAHVVATADTQPIFDLNILSSTLNNQLALLKQAAALGMPVTRVELGSELALPRADNEAAFPTGAAYGVEATKWATAIKKRFPDVQISVAAASGISAATTTDERRLQWNSGMLANLRNVDALSFHTYFTSGLPEGAAADDATNTATVMNAVTADWASVDATDLSILPAGMSAWITEYGLLDNQARVQGTWADGLATADFALQALARPQVQLLDAQGLEGSGVTSALYADTNGLTYDPPYLGPTDPAPTTAFGQSSLGVTLGAVMATLQGGGVVSDVDNNDPSNPGISTAAISTVNGDRLVVVNSSDSAADVAMPDWVDADSTVETWAATPDSYANGMQPVVTTGSAGTMTVPAYSITTVAAAT